MRNQLDQLGKTKNLIHGGQGLLIFIAWALTVAVYTKQGTTGVQTGFYLALCLLSIPVLIYQVMVPVYPRARRLANVYAYAAMDVLYTILWFSASIAVAVWNAAGLKEGKSMNNDSDGSCDSWAYGDASKCNVSKATVGFGIVIFFLFAATTSVSVIFVRRYRQTGEMPGLERKPVRSDPLSHGDPSKDVWSTTIEERDPEDIDELDHMRVYGQTVDTDEQALLHTSSHDTHIIADPHPGAELRYQPSMQSLQSVQQYDGHVPSALSPGGYSHEATIYHQPPPLAPVLDVGQADFPDGRYDRI